MTNEEQFKNTTNGFEVQKINENEIWYTKIYYYHWMTALWIGTGTLNVYIQTSGVNKFVVAQPCPYLGLRFSVFTIWTQTPAHWSIKSFFFQIWNKCLKTNPIFICVFCIQGEHTFLYHLLLRFWCLCFENII